MPLGLTLTSPLRHVAGSATRIFLRPHLPASLAHTDAPRRSRAPDEGLAEDACWSFRETKSGGAEQRRWIRPINTNRTVPPWAAPTRNPWSSSDPMPRREGCPPSTPPSSSPVSPPGHLDPERTRRRRASERARGRPWHGRRRHGGTWLAILAPQSSTIQSSSGALFDPPFILAG